MKRALLFPFKTTEDNEERYRAVRKAALAHQLPVIFFTTLPKKSDEEAIDAVYLYLLQLKGNYQSATNAWHERAPIGTKIVVQTGDLKKQVPLFIAKSEKELTVFT